MLNTSKFVLLTGILALVVSCSAKHEDEEPTGITYIESEVLVRQCQDINNLEFKLLLEKHKLSIRKQMSPHLYIVTWDDDDRHADEVVHELKSTTMFCGVDKYQAE